MFLIDRVPTPLGGFFEHLRGHFNKRQFRHFWGYVLALGASTDTKTLTEIASQLGTRNGTQRLSDFLVRSPWDAPGVLRKSTLRVLRRMNPRRGELLEVIIDGSKAYKRGSKMEATSWFFDYTKGGQVWGHQFVVCVFRFRGIVLPWCVDLYVPRNFAGTKRARELGLSFRTQNEIAAETIRQLPAALIRRHDVRVLFDTSFHNETVVQACQERGVHYISVAHSQRNFLPERARRWRKLVSYAPGVLKHEGQEIRVSSGRQRRAFWVTSRRGKMKGVGDVHAVFSQRRDGNVLTLATSDLDLSPREILVGYRARWSIEVFFKELKQHLGLSDYRTGWYEGVVNHLHLSMLSHLLLTDLGLSDLGSEMQDAMPAIEPVGRLTDRLRLCIVEDHLARIRRSNGGSRWVERFTSRLRYAA